MYRMILTRAWDLATGPACKQGMRDQFLGYEKARPVQSAPLVESAFCNSLRKRVVLAYGDHVAIKRKRRFAPSAVLWERVP
jgi:hypothetical protein